MEEEEKIPLRTYIIGLPFFLIWYLLAIPIFILCSPVLLLIYILDKKGKLPNTFEREDGNGLPFFAL